jgi:hypothetical protein
MKRILSTMLAGLVFLGIVCASLAAKDEVAANKQGDAKRGSLPPPVDPKAKGVKKNPANQGPKANDEQKSKSKASK